MEWNMFLNILFTSKPDNKKYVSQHIERDQLSQKIKVDLLLFSKWLFFLLNFGAKIVEIRHCILEI